MNTLKTKSIKDAVHGYIKVDEPFWRIIDTAEFQRLKWIEQTSYRVLYPSARHDRFIHSIGVFFLGQKAINGLIANSSSAQEAEIIDTFKDSFLLACLLHDIGHAPFSHTCEDLYNYQHKVSEIDSPINSELLSELKVKLDQSEFDAFKNDYRSILSPNGRAPSEHEIMSAIITCTKFTTFSSFFGDNYSLSIDLIVRSILGCTYENKRSDASEINYQKGIKNCLIRLLNSSSVDVDKLDYIARDTKMSGYDNIVLDTERLLNSVCIVCHDNIYYPSFKKSALSVINNVILAKNLQAKWIINHPIVIYESYILRRSIGETLKDYTFSVNGKSVSGDDLIKFIFSSKSLSKAGNKYINGTFSLLSDIDILNIMKQKMEISSVSEFFSRDERKKPIWKSNEEFLFCLGSIEKAREVSMFIAPLINYLNDIEDLSHPKQVDDTLYNEIKADDEIEGKEEILKILDILNNYKEVISTTELNYVVLPAKNRFYAEMQSSKLYIKFNETTDGYAAYEMFETKQTDDAVPKYKFFYIYSNKKLDSKHFLNYLYSAIHNVESVRI